MSREVEVKRKQLDVVECGAELCAHDVQVGTPLLRVAPSPVGGQRGTAGEQEESESEAAGSESPNVWRSANSSKRSRFSRSVQA